MAALPAPADGRGTGRAEHRRPGGTGGPRSCLRPICSGASWSWTMGFGTGGLSRKEGALCRLLILEHREPGWIFGTWEGWLEEEG